MVHVKLDVLVTVCMHACKLYYLRKGPVLHKQMRKDWVLLHIIYY